MQGTYYTKKIKDKLKELLDELEISSKILNQVKL